MIKKFFLSTLIVFASCKEDKTKRYVPESNGNINNITVVISKDLWKGNIGMTIRDKFEAPYEGLPIDEPIFSLKQLPPESFSGFARNSRNILWIKKDSVSSHRLFYNKYAKPQIIGFFSEENEDSLSLKIKENSDYLIRSFQNQERKEKKLRILKSRSKERALLEKFNFTLTYPSAYNTVKDTINFIWIEKKITKGTLNIVAYTIPLHSIKNNETKRIIKIRDSIGKIYIPGRLPMSYMVTEKAYTPYFYKLNFLHREAFLTKGTWEVKNDFMAGPFINYTIKDTINKRWIVIEGFSFAPSSSKREYMFELNTIINTLEIKN